MHLKELLNRFNISHLIFYSLLLLLVILVGLRGDGIISGPYSGLFFPLWIWYILLYVAVVIGLIRWCTSSSEFRQDDDNLYQFKSMLISVCLQSFLFITLLLAAVNIDTHFMPWSAVFTPLYLLPFLSIPTCIWNCYRKRSIEIEILSMSTFLQFIFLGIKLDEFVNWKWAIIFIPMWLLICLVVISFIIMGVVTLLSYALGENQQELEQKKLPDVLYFILATGFLFFFIIFMSLFSSRLDDNISGPYSAVLVPFYLSVFCLIGLTFCRRPANIWWFGVRKNFIDFLLAAIPLLQDYANVSYNKVQNTPVQVSVEKGDGKKGAESKKNLNKTELYPYEDIYAPD